MTAENTQSDLTILHAVQILRKRGGVGGRPGHSSERSVKHSLYYRIHAAGGRQHGLLRANQLYLHGKTAVDKMIKLAVPSSSVSDSINKRPNCTESRMKDLTRLQPYKWPHKANYQHNNPDIPTNILGCFISNSCITFCTNVCYSEQNTTFRHLDLFIYTAELVRQHAGRNTTRC